MTTKTLTKTEVAKLVAKLVNQPVEMATVKPRWEVMTWGCPTSFPE